MGAILAIPDWIGWALLTVSTLLAINAGKNLAAKKHDADLAKKYGKQLSIFGVMLYFYAIISIIFSLFSSLVTKIFSTSLKLMVSGTDLLPVLTGVAFPLFVMGLSYVVFHAKYNGINEPITREGKLAIRFAEREVGLRRSLKSVARPPSPIQLADRAVQSAIDITKLFKEENKKEAKQD